MPEDKTPAVFDFDAIRNSSRERDAVVETTPPEPLILASLIAEERQAWNAHSEMLSKADKLRFAWRKTHPDLDAAIECYEDLPEPMGSLYCQPDELENIANALTNRICAWQPITAAEAVTLLDWLEKAEVDEPKLIKSVLAGLRAIAARETPAAEPASDGSDDDAAEFAGIEFEPAPASDDLIAALSAPKWDEQTKISGITLRIATAIVDKTKDELIKITEGLAYEDVLAAGEKEQPLFWMMTNLNAEEKRLEALHDLVMTAHARMMIACACIEIRVASVEPSSGDEAELPSSGEAP
jgi:hypothetical protein